MRVSPFKTARVSAVDKLDPTVRADMEKQVEIMNTLLRDGVFWFRLKAPDKLTVMRGGSYSKSPYIGDNSFKGKAAYVGKSGKVIIQMEDIEGGVVVEMPLNECLTKLAGFSDFINRVQAIREDAQLTEANKEAEEIEDRAYQEAKRDPFKENSAFGSW